MAQRTNDPQNEMPLIGERNLFSEPFPPHAIRQGHPAELNKSNRWIASDTMYELANMR